MRANEREKEREEERNEEVKMKLLCIILLNHNETDFHSLITQAC